MNALYDAPAEAEEAYLEEFELGLVAEDDDRQDAPSPWIARACAAGALAAHVGLVALVLGTGFGWSFAHRGVDFARVVDVEIEPRLPRMESVAIPDAPKEAAGVPAQDRLALQSDAPEETAGVPAQDRLALQSDAPEEAAGVPAQDRLALQSDAPEEAAGVPTQDRVALRSALDALALAGDAETLETIASNLDAETDAGAGALPVLEGEPSELAASGAPISVAQRAESPVASSPPALSLSLPAAPDLVANSDMRELAEARERPGIVASEAAEDAVIARPASEQVREPSIAQARPGEVEETVISESGQDKTHEAPVVQARGGDAGETIVAQTEPEAAEGEADQGSAEDADVQTAQAGEARLQAARDAEARQATAKKVAADRTRAAAAAKKAAADRARAAATRKRHEEARRREAEKRKVAARKKSQAGAQASRLGGARRYAGMVRARVAARKPGLKGPSTVRIAYAVAPNGSLRYAKIAGANNSGFFMNQSSLAAVRSAAPFPPPPAGMTPGQLSFTVTFTYR